MITALIGALGLLGGTQATSEHSVARWSLQVEPARCVLERRNPEEGSTLSVDTTPGSDNYGVAITAGGIDASSSLLPASLTFAPSQKVTTGLARGVKLSNNTGAVLMQGLPPSVLDDLSGTSTVTIEVKKGIKTIVSVPGSTKAVEALRNCIADQLVEWGADPAQFAPGGMMPAALKDRDSWISNGELLKLAGQSQRTSINDDFRLLIAMDGTVAECHAMSDVTEPSLEKSACAAVMKRRLFVPARSSSGNAVLGAATFRVSLMRHTSFVGSRPL